MQMLLDDITQIHLVFICSQTNSTTLLLLSLIATNSYFHKHFKDDENNLHHLLLYYTGPGAPMIAMLADWPHALHMSVPALHTL